MMRWTEEPADDRWYWWLPKFLEHEPQNGNNWSIVYCSSGGGKAGRVGVFVGPLKAPIHENPSQ